MNTDKTNVAKEALTRELEHHIEKLCDLLIEDITCIKNNAYVNVENFKYMTLLGEALEEISSGVEKTLEYAASITVAEKIIKTTLNSSFTFE